MAEVTETTAGEGAATAEVEPKKKREVAKRTVKLFEVQDEGGRLKEIGTYASASKAKKALTKEHKGKTFVIGLMYDPVTVQVEEVPAKFKVSIK